MVIEYLEKESTLRLGRLLHFIIYHARWTQIFHKLRIGVKDLMTFSETIALITKEFSRLKNDPELSSYAKEVTKNFPTDEDIKEAQSFYEKYGKEYLQVLLARAGGFCSKCREEG
ncbi:MAG: hypothetical protein QXK35_06105 [Nitrososphaerales archaeon]